jgi:SAM-dependent methyltransferase
MSLLYRVFYWAGFRPWEVAAIREADRISAMFDREESGRGPPYGPALDLGCGTGMHAVALARRGWQVTGVEIIPRALRAARQRAREAGVGVRLVQGDVTALPASQIGSGFRLVLDFGCFHGLTDEQRAAMGREVSAITSPGATMLMIAWRRGRRGPLPRGASRADIEAAFPGWNAIGEDVLPVSALPAPLKNTDPRCYRFRRD